MLPIGVLVFTGQCHIYMKWLISLSTSTKSFLISPGTNSAPSKASYSYGMSITFYHLFVDFLLGPNKLVLLNMLPGCWLRSRWWTCSTHGVWSNNSSWQRHIWADRSKGDFSGLFYLLMCSMQNCDCRFYIGSYIVTTLTYCMKKTVSCEVYMRETLLDPFLH
jgi:hypothetical protein